MKKINYVPAKRAQIAAEKHSKNIASFFKHTEWFLKKLIVFTGVFIFFLQILASISNLLIQTPPVWASWTEWTREQALTVICPDVAMGILQVLQMGFTRPSKLLPSCMVHWIQPICTPRLP